MNSRTRRFVRSPVQLSIQPTGRDVEILYHVYRHRYVRSSHLTSLIAGSAQGTLRRLARLYHHGYLERPRIKRGAARGGSEPLVYGLAARGVELLRRLTDGASGRLDWLARPLADTRESLEHALMITDVMVGVELACRGTGHVRFLPGETGGGGFRWQATVSHRGMPVRIEMIPDQVFGLQFLRQPPEHNTIYFFLEADRGTMPVKRKDIDRSSFHRKLLAYYASWRQMLPQQLFGFSRFRVLTLTSSRERLAHLIEANQQFGRGGGSGLFLFADKETLRSHRDVLTLPFRSGRGGQLCRLIDG